MPAWHSKQRARLAIESVYRSFAYYAAAGPRSQLSVGFFASRSCGRDFSKAIFCGSSQSGWQTKTSTASDPSSCSFHKMMDGIPHLLVFIHTHPLADAHRQGVRAHLKSPWTPCIATHLE